MDYTDQMRLEMTLDEERLREAGLTWEEAAETVKRDAEKYKLQFIEDGAVFIVAENGNSSDYAYLLSMMGRMVVRDWFLKSAVSFLMFDDDPGSPEDILSQTDNIATIRHLLLA